VSDVRVSADIFADPKVVYDLVSDVTRMGEWSPETTSCRWLSGNGPAALGARFRGTNKRLIAQWTTTCTVTAADPGRRFAFDVRWGPWYISEWSYDIEPTPEGCRVTEAWADRRRAALRVSSPAVMGIVDRSAHNRRGMEKTLAALKAAAEA
jgi:ribosome-associated toxin RatA of RatAB toxin-antitoxin module